MRSAKDDLTANQLIGRIAYFHTLFIESALDASATSPSGEPCCNHAQTPAPTLTRATVAALLRPTAWNVLDEVAAAVPSQLRPCPRWSNRCCATCRVATAGAAVAAAWAEAEHRAYHRIRPPEELLLTCRTMAAARLGRAFAARYGAPCPAVDRAAATRTTPAPAPDALPLTGELLALWADPARADQRPVTGWLNHCTGLDDVRRVLRTRRSRT